MPEAQVTGQAPAPALCKRRPSSTFTKCRCDDCRREQYRVDKIIRLHGYRRADGDKAWAQVTALLDSGWSRAAIADAHGLSPRYIDCLISAHRNGERRRIGNKSAQAILRGPIRRPNHGRIPAIGSTRRLQALACIGWTNREIGRRVGVAQSVVTDAQGGKRSLIAAETAALIANAYGEMSARDGGSESARDRAQRLGWLPPLDWEDVDMDDPAARPYMTPGDRAVLILRLAGEGMDVEVIASEAGCTPCNVRRVIREQGVEVAA